MDIQGQAPILLEMRVLILVLTTLLTLTACAGGRTLSNDLMGLQGHPINDAFITLGEPTGSYVKGNQTVYVWQRQHRESVFGPSVTSGYGYQFGRRSSVLGSGLMWSGIQYDSCVLRAYTAGGTIQRITQEGNPGGCETIYRYRRRDIGYDISQRP